jgi:N-acetyl-anhydromuramyl-L-alanine amidase AmpD
MYRMRKLAPGYLASVAGKSVVKKPVSNGYSGWGASGPVGVVFHYTVGCTGDISGTLKSRGISVHFNVAQDGTIYQFRSMNDRAWHADVANSFYFGVEHAAIPRHCDLNDKQLEASAELMAAIVDYTKKRFGKTIPLKKIDGPDLVPGFHDHKDGDGKLWNFNRHTDGLYKWSWTAYLKRIDEILHPEAYVVVATKGKTTRRRRFPSLKKAWAFSRDLVQKSWKVAIRKR